MKTLEKLQSQSYCHVPMQWVGPLNIGGSTPCGDLQFTGKVPLATFEAPIWNSVARGARISKYAPIQTYFIHSCMTRSVLIKAGSLRLARQFLAQVFEVKNDFIFWTEKTSRFCRYQSVHGEIFGNRVWLRFSFETASASGHNMATKAATYLAQQLLACKKDSEKTWQEEFGLELLSDSGNLCCDKKVSSINAVLGRGCHVQAQMRLSKKLCERFLRATPEKIQELCLEKNWVSSVMAGSLHSANAHIANMLLAFYIATGQDGANIVEGSQSQSICEIEDQDLLLTCRFPHLIVGTIGAGKAFGQECLAQLGCSGEKDSKQRLAQLMAATALCGELSLLGALANPGELLRSHERIERGQV